MQNDHAAESTLREWSPFRPTRRRKATTNIADPKADIAPEMLLTDPRQPFALSFLPILRAEDPKVLPILQAEDPKSDGVQMVVKGHMPSAALSPGFGGGAGGRGGRGGPAALAAGGDPGRGTAVP